MSKWYSILGVLPFFLSCSSDAGDAPTGSSELPGDDKNPEVPTDPIPTDTELLDLAQETSFAYFWDFAETHSGAARERYHPDDPQNDPFTVTTGGSGFGIMALIVGMERNFIPRSEGLERLARILDFFENADCFHGAWPHWLDGRNGSVLPFSTYDNGGDLVETAFLCQGLICLQEYLKNGDTAEKELALQAKALWEGVEWGWYTQDEDTLYWHWSPNYGFIMNLPLKGYNETLITYVLAAASPDFGIPSSTYDEGWASNGAIRSTHVQYGYPLGVAHIGHPNYGGPLFWAHYSYLGLDPRHLSDAYADYWQVNVNHAKINYSYCVENPKGYPDYGTDCWGLTASYTREADGSLGYNAHSPANDTGVISPTAALASMPYTPEESMRALRYFYAHKDALLGPAGFYDAFDPGHGFWVAKAYLAIDQGPIVVMLENHRTALLWNLFMQNEAVQTGLDHLGFTY